MAAWGRHIADVVFTIGDGIATSGAPIWHHGAYYRAAHQFSSADAPSDGDRGSVERSVLYLTVDAAAARLAQQQCGVQFRIEMLPIQDDGFSDIAPTPPPIRDEQVNWNWPELPSR